MIAKRRITDHAREEILRGAGSVQNARGITKMILDRYTPTRIRVNEHSLEEIKQLLVEALRRVRS